MSNSVTEFFNGGIVTSRHPALLQENELQQAEDCIYRDNDSAIWRAPGRWPQVSTAINSGTAVKGFVHLTYEGTRSDYIIAYVGDKLLAAPISSVLASPTTATANNCLSFSTVITGPGRIDVKYTSTSPITFEVNDVSIILSDAMIGATIRSTDTSFPSFTGTNSSSIVTSVTPGNGTNAKSTFVVSHAPRAVVLNTSYTLFADYGVPFIYNNDGEEILDGAFYGTSYFLWNGKGNPIRLDWRSRTKPDGTAATVDDILVARPCGLLPVIARPTVTSATTGGIWPSSLGIGTYWFVLTEICSINSGGKAVEIESAYLGKNSDDATSKAGDPVSVSISSLTSVVTFITPKPRNVGEDGRYATHWGVYMAGPTTDSSLKPSMATFKRCAKISMKGYDGGQTIKLTNTKAAPPSGDVVYYPDTVTSYGNGFLQFTNPSNMCVTSSGVQNEGVAASKSGSNNNNSSNQCGINVLSGWRTANENATSGSAFASTQLSLSGVETIGVEIQVTGRSDPSGNSGKTSGYGVTLMNNTFEGDTDFRDYSSKNMATNYSGGATSMWNLPTFNSGNVANLKVKIFKTGTGGRQTVNIDKVGIRLTCVTAGTGADGHSGVVNLNGVSYRVVTYRDQIGTTINDPVNLPMPICTTGDFFQGSLVTDDLGDETAIRFSVSGNPEAFPQPYYMRFNSKKRDNVTYIKRLGSILIVGLKESIKRINYLPKETDTDMQSGIAHEDIVTDHGIPGPLAAVKFDMPGEGAVLAYATNSGVYITNGIYSRPLSIDLDWANTVKLSALPTCVFKVNPKEKWLALYYCPAGATHNKNTRVIYFCYQADKLKGASTLPVIGPSIVSARSACELMVNGTPYIFTGSEEDGKIYCEDNGLQIPSGYQVADSSGTLAAVTICPKIKTRRIYHAGFNRDARVEQILLLYSPYGTQSAISGVNTVKDTSMNVANGTKASVKIGARITGTGIYPGTAIISVGADNSAGAGRATVVLSRAPYLTSTNVSLVQDTGCLAVTVSGAYTNSASTGTTSEYVSTYSGDLLSCHADHIRQGMELKFEKVPITFDSDRNSTSWADLQTNMRLHSYTAIISDEGAATNRTSL